MSYHAHYQLRLHRFTHARRSQRHQNQSLLALCFAVGESNPITRYQNSYHVSSIKTFSWWDITSWHINLKQTQRELTPCRNLLVVVSCLSWTLLWNTSCFFFLAISFNKSPTQLLLLIQAQFKMAQPFV